MKSLSFWDLIILFHGIEALTHILVLTFYPPKKAKLLCTEASHPSFPNERPGLEGCDITGRILKSKRSEHNVDFLCQE